MSNTDEVLAYIHSATKEPLVFRGDMDELEQSAAFFLLNRKHMHPKHVAHFIIGARKMAYEMILLDVRVGICPSCGYAHNAGWNIEAKSLGDMKDACENCEWIYQGPVP